jgi:hypothetical protein
LHGGRRGTAGDRGLSNGLAANPNSGPLLSVVLVLLFSPPITDKPTRCAPLFDVRCTKKPVVSCVVVNTIVNC